MKLMMEFKYAILLTLLMLLWLSIEFMVGLHDKYISLHPIVTMFSLVIPILVSRQAIKEKRESLKGQITFKEAFVTGMIITAIATVLAIPMQFIFHYAVNPDFFDTMIAYTVQRARDAKMDPGEARMHATMYFNLQSYISRSVFITLIVGSFIAFVTAFVMRTKK